jgi:hypothetical protein
MKKYCYTFLFFFVFLNILASSSWDNEKVRDELLFLNASDNDFSLSAIKELAGQSYFHEVGKYDYYRPGGRLL